MKERPILMSAPMVIALLEGRKIQTRRIVKPQPEVWLDGSCHWDKDTGGGYATEKSMREWMPHDCPKGKPGDRLWVRESFQPLLAEDVEWKDADYETGEGYAVNYVATGGVQEFYDFSRDESFSDRVTPSIFMPRWASRIMLEITDVRVERLQDISEEDAIAEGIAPLFDEKERLAVGCNLKPMPWNNYLWHGHVGRSITAKQSKAWPHQFSSYDDPRLSYSSLWESINGFESWAANPFVWCISFKVL